MDTFNIIKPLPCANGWYSKTIPAGFDDSVSYLQMLSGILAKQKEIIKQLNINTEFIKSWDEDLTELQARMSALEAEMTDFKNEVNANIEAKFVILKNELIGLIASGMSEIKAYIDTQVSRLDGRIDNIAIGQITVYDPTTGVISPLQQVINNIYDSARENALTATEFDGLDLSATAFDAYEITAFEFDNDGKTILV
ncbi:MAG: hypothetical protein J6S67_02300 [Methanobrevibacter sp.]|nr:hypothetical protein [Methanobrevibacter sp.]